MDDTHEVPKTIAGYPVEMLSSTALEGFEPNKLYEIVTDLRDYFANVSKALDRAEHMYLQKSIGMVEGRCVQFATGDIYKIRRVRRVESPIHGKVTRVTALAMSFDGEKIQYGNQTMLTGDQLFRVVTMSAIEAEEAVIRKYLELEHYKEELNGKKEA